MFVFGGFKSGDIEIVPGIHLSFHTDMVLPSPTHEISPILSPSFPAMIAFHVAEADFGEDACMKLVSGKYRPFKIVAQREFGFVKRCHPCFPNIARLN